MEKYADINGLKVYYQVEGSGANVILVHGNGLSHGQWRHNVDKLSRYYKVYAPDLPGFGLSDKPEAEYGLDYYVNFLKNFMDALDIPKAAVIGNSFGGAIAAVFASRFPDRVTSLVLSNATGLTPNGISKNKELTNMFLNLMMRNRKLYCRPMFYDSSATKLLEDTLLVTDMKEMRSAFSKNCSAIIDSDAGYIRSVMGIRAPTLIIWGKDDVLLPPSDAEKYKTLIGDSRLKIVDKCGHMPNVEKHGEFNTAVLNFLAGVKH